MWPYMAVKPVCNVHAHVWLASNCLLAVILGSAAGSSTVDVARMPNIWITDYPRRPAVGMRNDCSPFHLMATLRSTVLVVTHGVHVGRAALAIA